MRKNPRLSYGVIEEGVNPHSSTGMLVTPAVKAAAALWRALVSATTFFRRMEPVDGQNAAAAAWLTSPARLLLRRQAAR